MKRIYLILIAAVAITFTSCSDRDMDTVKPDTGQGAPIIDLPEGATQGKILVKFKPEAAYWYTGLFCIKQIGNNIVKENYTRPGT